MATAVTADDVIDVDPDASSDEVIQRALKEDPDFKDIMDKFDSSVCINADHNLNIDYEAEEEGEGSSVNADSDSVSTSSSFKDPEELHNGASAKSTPEPERRKNGVSATISVKNNSHPSPSSSIRSSNNGHHRNSPSKDSLTSRDSSASEGGMKKAKSSIRNSLKALKKLTKFADKEDPKKSGRKRSFNSEFTAIVVDRLPQVFVVKYLGHREVQGMSGLHHVRRPVDEMVKVVKTNIESEPQMELPLLYVVISPKGLDLREHKCNKVKKGYPPGLMPIDFISYGVQDIKYWRVFTCIVVEELSSRSRLASCHAFLCDSSHSGRKMALALGAAFSVISKKLKSDGKHHNFQVELRPPDELADAVDAEFEA